MSFTRTSTTIPTRPAPPVKETVGGTLYYEAPRRMAVMVSEPLNQWVLLDSSTMVLFYPDEQKAFRIKASNPFILPFFQVYLGIMKDELGLPEMGFTSDRNEVRGDTLVSFWAPPRQLKKTVSHFVVGYVENRIAFTELRDPKGRAIAHSEFSNFYRYGQDFFPLDIRLRQQWHDKTTIERVTLKDPQFDIELPARVREFMLSPIPEQADVREVEW